MNELCDQLCRLPPEYLLAAYIVNLVIEAWLGSTTKTKSGSMLALVFNLMLAPVRWHLNRRIESGKTL